MSDVIVVMKSGTIQQIGYPQDIYNEPANAFVADFIGESNIFDGFMSKDGEVTIGADTFPCVDARPEGLSKVDVVVRPEDVEIVSPDKGIATGVVEASLFKGVHYEMTVKSGDLYWLIHSTKTTQVGETIGMYVTPENIHIMKPMFAEEQKIAPENVKVVAAGEGDFDAYLDSVIWKSNHYEMILVDEEGRRILAKSQMDEQAGTTVGVVFETGAEVEA